jgi:hypothetical protein
MQHHDAGAEAAPEALHQLRRQGDLRHQNQRLAAGGDGRGNDAQVHLGLAAAGDAVQQVRGKLPREARGVHHHRLRVGQRHLAGAVQTGGLRQDGDLRPAALRQGFEQGRLEVDRDLVLRGAGAFGQPLQQGSLLRRAPAGGLANSRRPASLRLQYSWMPRRPDHCAGWPARAAAMTSPSG